MFTVSLLLACFLAHLFSLGISYPISELSDLNNNQVFRERRASANIDSASNSPYLRAIRQLTINDGPSLNSLNRMEPGRNLMYPTNVFQRPYYWTMMRGDNSNPEFKQFSSSDLLCRKLRMC